MSEGFAPESAENGSRCAGVLSTAIKYAVQHVAGLKLFELNSRVRKDGTITPASGLRQLDGRDVLSFWKPHYLGIRPVRSIQEEGCHSFLHQPFGTRLRGLSQIQNAGFPTS